MPEWFRLIGIVIVVAGFAFRLRTTIVVMAGALATGLVAGIPLLSALGKPGQEGLIDMLGRAFVENRLMTLFIITLPAIGLAERYGLLEQSAAWIRRVRSATVGRLSILYQLFRILHGILGLRLTGHASFVRPLIFPMSAGAMEAKDKGELDPEKVEKIKAANSASENYGNFYGQNLSVVQPGVLLVYGVMKSLGIEVSLWRMVLFTSPIVFFSVVIAAVQFIRLDRVLGFFRKDNAKQ
jgi:uncharacterized membrane protein